MTCLSKKRLNSAARSILLLTLASIIFIPMALYAQQPLPEIKAGEVITLDRAIALALYRHPTILASRSTVEASQSRIGQAQANYWPQIDFTSGYTRGNQGQGGVNPVNLPGTSNYYTGNFSGTQNIYDFGRTSSQVKVQQFSTESARSDLANTREQIVLGLKQAYFGLLQARRNRTVAEETTGQFQQHLDQARGFYEVGTKSKFDVTKAEVDLSNARLNQIRAENAVRTSKVSLDNAIGISGAPDYSVEDVLSFQPYEITYDEALKQAFANRPDLQAIISRKKAAEQSLRLAHASYYPTLTGSANLGWSGTDFPLGNGWSVGAAINVPLFTGFLSKYQVAEAKANLKVLDANEESIRQSITLNVQQALLSLQEAKERMSVADLTVRQAAENLDLANGRYTAGVGNPIELTDALVNLSNARTSYNQALYDYKIAQAAMDKAIGVKY